MVAVRVVVIMALVAAAAGATFYVDERFEGVVPPPGWTKAVSIGEWTSGTGGPWGNFADGYANPPYASFGTAILYSPQLTVEVGKTLYYRFYYRSGASGNAGGWGWYFYLYYQDNPASPLATANLGRRSSWTERTGSGYVDRSAPILARWEVYGGGLIPPSTAYIYLNVDTAQISDLPFTAVAPASLGKVKAVFR